MLGMQYCVFSLIAVLGVFCTVLSTSMPSGRWQHLPHDGDEASGQPRIPVRTLPSTVLLLSCPRLVWMAHLLYGNRRRNSGGTLGKPDMTAASC